jgi:hypothetical protein
VTLDDLRALLATVGVPVLDPGDTTRPLPCLQLSPVEWQLRPGYPALYPVLDLYVAVDLTPYDTQHNRLSGLLVDVCRALADSSFNLDPTIRYVADAEASPPYQAAVVNVRYPGPDICPPDPAPNGPGANPPLDPAADPAAPLDELLDPNP